MKEHAYIVGIDVAKEEVAVTVLVRRTRERISFQVANEGEELERTLTEKIKDLSPQETLTIMEHTGVYHLRLAFYLWERGYTVVVCNPLQVRRFAQSKIKRTKTDRIDSALLVEYAEKNEDLKPFTPPDPLREEVKLRLSQLEDLYQALRTLENQKMSMEFHPLPLAKSLVLSYERVIQNLHQEIEKQEEELKAIVRKYFPKEICLLRSIPGIGPRAAWVIVSYLRSFEGFERAKEVASYIGICPSVYESGKRRRSEISKRGYAYVRKILYLCALSASRFNRACRELFERLVQRGKTKKQALIAVAHKLLRQAFAVLKRGVKYNEESALGMRGGT